MLNSLAQNVPKTQNIGWKYMLIFLAQKRTQNTKKWRNYAQFLAEKEPKTHKKGGSYAQFLAQKWLRNIIGRSYAHF